MATRSNRVAARHEKLASPRRAVGPVTGAVPRHAQHRVFEFVLRHAGCHVREVVLNVHDRQAEGACIPGREVVGMQVGDHLRRLDAVEIAERRDHPLECVGGLQRFEIADVLADEEAASDVDPDCILQMCADRERGRHRSRQKNRERGISARAPDHHLASEHHADNRVVDVSDDRTIVDEKQVGHPLQSVTASRSSIQRGSSARLPLVATTGRPMSRTNK